MAVSKRFQRPPVLSLGLETRPVVANTVIELESPVIGNDDDDDETSSGSSIDSESDLTSDDISKDLAALEKLRKNVQNNLRLRPIRSNGALPVIDLQIPPFRDHAQSPSSAGPSTAYFTPLSDIPLSGSLSARYLGTDSRFDFLANPRTTAPSALDPGTLFERLSSSIRPLLIDTRSPQSHLSSHIQYSINIAVPSLILKRCKKPAGAFQSLDALRQFITTEQGKDAWDKLTGNGCSWDNNVVIYDQEMDLNEKSNPQSTAWALIPVIAPLLTHGTVEYLKGGMSAARQHRDLSTLVLSGGDFHFGDDQFEDPSQIKKGAGLFQLDTAAASARCNPLPDLDPSTRLNPPPLIPPVISGNTNLLDSTPSPPPSQLAFHRRPPPPRRPSAPSLRRLDTRSADHLNSSGLPKLQVRTLPIKSATLSVPPLHISIQPHSPSHLNLAHSNHSPPGSALPKEFHSTPFTSYFTPPHTPSTPMPLPPSPATARPDIDPPSSAGEHAEVFTISAILPHFLFLGPELTTHEHLEQLQELGVKRILNMAAECDDDKGLRLRDVFDKYTKISWRDTVEEEDIARGVREVCEVLDDARLHSAPTYVHCKAGKSRSVTAVMAYLIHANHWTLSQAYSFVVERRKGISPNIGFVSELMTFEEEELGGKSNGVQPSAAIDQDGEHHESSGYMAASNRRPGHIRESLPPVFVTPNSDGNHMYSAGPISAAPISNARVGDSGQEMEIKDSFGRYRHARRAPVDEQTLQPLRRVSKAGLESSVYS